MTLSTDVLVIGARRAQWEAWAAEPAFREGGTYVTVAGWPVAGAAGALSSLLDIGRAPEGKVLGVVELATHPSWSAAMVARALGAVVVSAAGGPEGETFAQTARAFDTEGVAEGFAAALAARSRDVYALLMPPVLGFRRSDVAARMSRAAGVPVGEAAGGPGDPTAIRMDRALRQWLPAGVEVLTARASVLPGRRVDVSVAGEAVRAAAVVLATGGLTGGGLVFDGALREATAGAPVWTSRRERVMNTAGARRGADPVEWFDPHEGKATGAGLRVDDDARVLDAVGTFPLAAWLFAAGAVVSGRGDEGLTDVVEAGAAAGRAAARHAAGA
ncbi:MAG: hypothetical protein R3A52_29100 [Polyangiales bacterium]